MINIINAFLRNQDKIAHFFISGWIYAILLHFFNNIFLGFFITLIIGFVKEIYDWKFRNGADFYDIVANVLGIFLTMLIFGL